MSQFVTLNRIMKDDYHYNEAIKTLRTNIQFCGSGIKTIMLTSSLPDEGKSDITFAMASSLAQIGKKVVMIDADIRKSVLVSRYQLEREVSGLSQYLSGQRSLENVLYDTSSTIPLVSRELVYRMFDRFGPERFLFGSDFPMWKPEDAVEQLLSFDLGTDVMEKILYGNFCRLLGLDAGEEADR